MIASTPSRPRLRPAALPWHPHKPRCLQTAAPRRGPFSPPLLLWRMRLWRLLLLLLPAILTTPSTPAADLEITIDPVFNGEPLRPESLRYVTAAGETISVTRLSWLLSGFALRREDGQWLEFPGRNAWFDTTSRRNRFLLKDIPPGTFRGLRFHIGPDAAANSADISRLAPEDPLNPNLNGLHWSWQSGYIFLAMEGYFRPPHTESQGYALHLARDPNRTRIELAADLDFTQAGSNTSTSTSTSTGGGGILLHFDLAALLNAPRPLSFIKDGAATHSRPGDPISAALVANLPGAFRVHRLAKIQPALPGSGEKSKAAPAIPPLDFPDTFTPWPFTLSRTFPIPDLPRDNPLIAERVRLGEKLFHDPLLSRDNTISCATCHRAEAAFTDQLPVSAGIGGRLGERNAMPLLNLAWKKEFFWDGRAKSLREQVLMPIQDHREMDESPARLCEKLAAGAPSAVSVSNPPPAPRAAAYRDLFRAAFRSGTITPQNIALALEQYLLTLTARNAKFDRVLAGRESFSEAEARGLELFMTESDPRSGQTGADCFHCHGGPLFSDHGFHNNGLEILRGGGGDTDRAKVTGNPADQQKFATPSLRNIALTAPYMHDGRFATLEQVIEHYSSGIQRSPTLDPNLAKHPAPGLNLPPADKAALAAFLRTLTDEK